MTTLRTLAFVMLVACMAVPTVAQASGPFSSGETTLTLPEARPALQWHRGSDLPDARERAVAVDGEVDAKVLRATLDTLYVRRQMLTAHQVLAWTSAFSIIAAEVVGMINRIALLSGSIPRRDMEPLLGLHRGLAGTAIGTYWTAGVLAWTMPSPSGRREHKGISEWKDTRDVHIILSIIHTVAMGVVTATGILQANLAKPEAWEPLMVAHTTAGFVTAGFVFTAAIVIGRN